MHEIDRRDVLGLLSSTLLFSQVPNTAFAYSSTDLHEYAAAKAKSLADGKVKKLGLLMPNGSSANVLPVIGAFGQMSGIDVIPIETPVDDINVQLTLDALTGKGEYDVALPATFGLPDLVNAGAIQPLTDFVARHQPAGFQDGMLYQTGDSFDGEVYGYQTDGDAYVMFYNRDLLQDEDEQKRFEDSFGFPLDVPKTWSQLPGATLPFTSIFIVLARACFSV